MVIWLYGYMALWLNYNHLTIKPYNHLTIKILPFRFRQLHQKVADFPDDRFKIAFSLFCRRLIRIAHAGVL